MMMNSSGSEGGTYKWMRNDGKVKGIVVLFAWISIPDAQINEFVDLYSSFHWTSLVCRSDYLNPYAFLTFITCLLFLLVVCACVSVCVFDIAGSYQIRFMCECMYICIVLGSAVFLLVLKCRQLC